MRIPRIEHYGILKVSKTATLDEIKKAYRKRAFELHPDLHPENPNANKEFQLLNEAYVLLTAYVNKPKYTPPPKPESNYQSSTEDSTYFKQKDPNSYNSSSKFTKQEEPKKNPYAKTENLFTSNYKRKTSTDERNTESHKRTYSKAQSAYERESNKASSHVHSANPKDHANFVREDNPTPEELMQDILKDPFARRVYEDIYSTLEEKKDNFCQSPYTGEKKKKSILNTDWITDNLHIGVDKNIGGNAKSWLKKQIDDHIEYELPVKSLYPRSRIRLQIGQGFSKEPRTVEITLPPDFVIGKPVRLSGLGKKLGKWTGDLYITFVPTVE